MHAALPSSCTTDPVKLWPIMSIDEFGDWQPGRTFDRCKIDWNRVQDGQDPDTVRMPRCPCLPRLLWCLAAPMTQ